MGTQGASIQFLVTQGPDGRLQASQQSKIGGSAVPTTSTGQVITGTVKSYNVQKGWGLIVSPGIPGGERGVAGDVFFMKSNLPQELRDLSIAGTEVRYELCTTPDGKFRAQ